MSIFALANASFMSPKPSTLDLSYRQKASLWTRGSLQRSKIGMNPRTSKKSRSSLALPTSTGDLSKDIQQSSSHSRSLLARKDINGQINNGTPLNGSRKPSLKLLFCYTLIQTKRL